MGENGVSKKDVEELDKILIDGRLWEFFASNVMNTFPGSKTSEKLLSMIRDPYSWDATYFVSRAAKSIQMSRQTHIDSMKIIDDKTKTLDLRFYLFYIIFTWTRDQDSITELKNLHDKYSEIFKSIDFMKYLEGIYLKLTRNPSLISMGIEILDEYAESYDRKGNPGFLQGYADAVTIALEEDMQDTGFDKEEHMIKSIKRINQAILRKPENSKYFYTRAKLRLHQRAYDKAKADTRKAMDKHAKESPFETERLNEYRRFLIRIETQMGLHELKNLKTQSENLEIKIREIQ